MTSIPYQLSNHQKLSIASRRRVTALGHKQTIYPILPQRLLPGPNRTFDSRWFEENFSGLRECLLFPKAVVQIIEILAK